MVTEDDVIDLVRRLSEIHQLLLENNLKEEAGTVNDAGIAVIALSALYLRSMQPHIQSSIIH
jgi:Trp operon repressor